MVAIEDIRGAMVDERAAVSRDQSANHNLIFGNGESNGAGEPDMPGDAIFIAGDVTLPPEPQKPQPQPQPQPQLPPPNTGNPLRNALLAAALGGGLGVGGAALYNYLNQPDDKPAVQATDSDTTGTLQKDK